MNRSTTMPQKKKKASAPSRPQAVKRTEKRERIKRFVKTFYDQYGDMMSRLSHE